MRFPSLLRAARAPLLATLLIAASVPAQASDWLVISGLSRHFQQDREDWREFNPGLGFERDSSEYHDVAWTGGYFRNSYDRNTFYAGARWMPLSVGPIRFGGFALAATGYPSPVLVLPALSLEGERVGLNIVALPNLPGYSGYVAAQVRFKLD